MLSLVFEGILFGLVIAITPGPIFFSILQTGVNRGFRAGLFTALGVLLSDILLISICYFGISSLINLLDNKMLVGLVGGIILIIFGTFTFTRKPEMLRRRMRKNSQITYKEPHLSTFMLKGFFINLSNPTLIIFWLSAMSFVSSQGENGHLINNVFAFFGGTLITIFSTDLLKSFIGKKIKNYLNLRKQLYLNMIIGTILCGSGIFLIFKIVFENFYKL